MVSGCCVLPFTNSPKLKALSTGQSLRKTGESSIRTLCSLLSIKFLAAILCSGSRGNLLNPMVQYLRAHRRPPSVLQPPRLDLVRFQLARRAYVWTDTARCLFFLRRRKKPFRLALCINASEIQTNRRVGLCQTCRRSQ